jgi:hypothetical protein
MSRQFTANHLFFHTAAARLDEQKDNKYRPYPIAPNSRPGLVKGITPDTLNERRR